MIQRVTSAVAACALAIASGGTAQTSVPPPPAKSQASQAVEAVQTVNTAGGLLFDGAMLAAPAGTVGSKVFEYKGNTLAVTKQIVDVSGAAMRGDVPAVFRTSTAAIADRCVDMAVNAACGLTGPGQPACVVAVQAARFCAETYYGTSAGEQIVKYGEKGLNFIGETAADMRRAQDANRQGQSARFNAASADNDQSSAFASSAHPVAQDDGSAMMMAAIMSGIGAAVVANSQPPIPYRSQPSPAQTAQPTGCHPGHDESAHPNGCHDASRSGATQ